MRKSAVILSILLFIISKLFSQETELKAVYTNQAIIPDGKLNDSIWQTVIPFSGFRMVEPVPGSDPTERTEVRILYNKVNLYIAVRCFDREPQRVSSNSMEHDQAEERNEDQVSIMLDPFMDKRNGYLFVVNPRGARSEGYAQGEHSNLSWDGIWNAKCNKDAEGWSTEIVIPFMSLSFDPKLNSWGINIERYIARKQEIIRLSGISLNSFFTNPNEGTLLKGIENVKQGYGFTLRPYGITNYYRDKQVSEKFEPETRGGLDIYKNITPNLVAAVTYHTDFAETEVDERQLNLTRFPLFYPEKRTFFLEGSDIFEFGNNSAVIPFFSRRIGLHEGETVPLELGAKIYGKVGKTNISALDVQTEAMESLPGNNMFAARVSQNIFKESKTGIIVTNGDPTGKQNTLAGADFSYNTSRFLGNYNFSAKTWGLYNWNELKGGHKQAFGLTIDYPNDLLDFAVTYNYVGDSINPGLGFMPRNAYHYLYTGIEYMPRPENGWIGKMVRQWYFEFRVYNYWNLKGDLESRQVFTAPINIRTESGEHLEFNIIPNREVLPYDFEVSEGIVIPKGDYSFVNYGAEINTAEYRKLQGELSYRFGNFYDGNFSDIEAGLNLKINGYATLGLKSNFIRGELPSGSFAENVYQCNLNLFISPDLGLKTNLQFDDVSDQMGFNGKLFWQFKPGNMVYLVYNSNWIRQWDPDSRFIAQEQKLTFKLQLNIRF